MSPQPQKGSLVMKGKKAPGKHNTKTSPDLPASVWLVASGRHHGDQVQAILEQLVNYKSIGHLVGRISLLI